MIKLLNENFEQLRIEIKDIETYENQAFFYSVETLSYIEYHNDLSVYFDNCESI